MVVGGTAVSVGVVVKPSFTPVGTFSATATDATGTLLPAVTVQPNNDGSYTFALTTSNSISDGHHRGDVRLNLCQDAGCTASQVVASVSVPFDINVLTPASPWPGDNLSALSAWTAVPDWAMFQGNAAHTGLVPIEVNPDKFSSRWQAVAPNSSGGSRYSIAETLATANGKFFVGHDTTLFARNEFDGTLAWKYDFSGLAFPSVNPPSVANGTVYVAAGQQSSTYLFAFDAANGDLRFRAPMSSQWESYLAPTIGSEGVYANAGSYGGLYAIAPSGDSLYFSPMAQTSMWTPAVDATGVYSYTGGLLKVTHPTTGVVLDSISDPTFSNYIYEIGGSPVLGATNSVFVANYENSILNDGNIGNTLSRFDLANDVIAWQMQGVYPSTPAYAAGVLYAVNNRPFRLEARAESKGELLWSWTPPHSGDAKFAGEVLLTKNLVFVSTNRSTYAIDLNSHRTVWSYPMSGRLALSANGVFYIQGVAALAAFNFK